MIPIIPIIVPLYSHYMFISMVCFMGIPLYYYYIKTSILPSSFPYLYIWNTIVLPLYYHSQYIWNKIYGRPPRQHWAATASGNGKRNSEVSLRSGGFSVVTVVTVSLQIILKIFRVFTLW